MTVDELENVDEIVDDDERVPDDDCDKERVPQGDAVKEPVTLPDALTEGDEDVDVEPVVLPDSHTVIVPDGLKDVDEVREGDKVGDPVDDKEAVIVPDCETVPVPQGETLREPEAVTHALDVVDGVGDVETDVVTETLFELVADEVSGAENDDDTVDDMESVPDAD